MRGALIVDMFKLQSRTVGFSPMQDQGSENNFLGVCGFPLYDFINDSNFDQFIDLDRGDTGDTIPPTTNFHGELMFGSGAVDDLFGPAQPDVLHFNPTSTVNSLPPFAELFDISGEDDHEDNSSADTPRSSKSTKGDRSKTLVSERRRRTSMKEKLYALRSLVPNITKMDKASIIGDAVSYVQELQMQAKKIKAEIAGLEASLSAARQFQGPVEDQKQPNNVGPYQEHPVCRSILQMDVFQVEQKEYYGRVVCNKGEGIAAALHKALESLLCSCDIKSSNLSTVSERFVLTFTVDVKECGEKMNASTLKLWVTRALFKQGFQIGRSTA